MKKEWPLVVLLAVLLLLSMFYVLFIPMPSFACSREFDATCEGSHDRRGNSNDDNARWREWPCEGPWFRRDWYRQNEQQWYDERCS